MEELLQQVQGLTDATLEKMGLTRVHTNDITPEQKQCMLDHQGQLGTCSSAGGWTPYAP